MRKRGFIPSPGGVWRLCVLGAVFLLLACRLPESLIGELRRPQATLLPTATITPVRVISDMPRFTSTLAVANPEDTDEPAPTASPVSSPAASAATGTDAALAPPEATASDASPVPTISPAENAAETPDAYPPAQAPLPATAYPGAATDVPIFNPYPDGTTPTLAVLFSPSPEPGSLPLTSTLASGSAEPSSSSSSTWTAVFVSPTPSRPARAGSAVPTRTPPPLSSPTPTPTRTPFSLPTPTLTRTPTATRTPLPAPPWVSARIVASDPGKVVLAAGKPQLVEFFAFWSGPSLALAPIIQGVEREFVGRVIFTYLDIDDPAVRPFKQELAFRYEPHFFLLDGQGNVLQQWLGNLTTDELRRALDEALR